MTKYISKDALVAEIENLLDKGRYNKEYDCAYRDGNNGALYALKNKLNTIEVEESDETAEAFARIIRANLTGIDKDVQYKFEQLYKKITGEKMYQGYKD